MNISAVQIDFFIMGFMLALTLLGLGVASAIPGMDRWSRRFFVLLFAILAVSVSVALVDLIIYGLPGTIMVEQFIWAFESLLATLSMPMFTLYLLRCCGESTARSALFRAVSAMWALYFIEVIIAQFTPWFYYTTPDYQFERGPGYWVGLLPLIFIMVLNLAGVIRRRDKLSRKYYIVFLIHLIPLGIAIVIHSIIYNFLVLDTGLTLSMLVMFAIILLDNVDRYMRQQREIAHQRASVMVLQMRPHFIHNTMTSIYYLCGQDPKKAQQVTLDFNTYLRRNFTAIASDHTIPFSEELEHTRAYLAVEQAQFEDRLFVDYDTPHTLFRLPPLTLQPIVENAVKHGMDPDAEPLRIAIRTRSTDNGSEITVSDNGPGFEPADDKEPHIALANIQQRLEMMCGGKLAIQPRAEGGTVVRVTIP